MPLAQKEEINEQDANKTKTELRGTETILLVEDNDSVREVTSSTLLQYGYTIYSASNGREALSIFHEYRDTINLVLTDVIMPQMSGRELAEKITAEKANMKILYFSGYTDNSIVHHGVLDEGMEFIQKPFSHIELANKIKEVLKKK